MRVHGFTLLFLSLTVQAAEPPNILFIYTDDQSHRTVSCYPESHDWVKTPPMDSVAANGVRFRNNMLVEKLPAEAVAG